MNIRYITTLDDMPGAVQALEKHSVWYVDTETTGLDTFNSRLLLVQIKAGDVVYVFDFVQLPEHALQQLSRGLTASSIVKVAHNASFDIKVFFEHGGILLRNVHDTYVSERLLFSGLSYDFSLRGVVERRFGIKLDKTVRAEFTSGHTGTFTPEQLEYAARDVDVLPRVYEQQRAEIEAKELTRVYRDEMELVVVTAMIEYTGMPINVNHLEALRPQFERIIKESAAFLQDLFIRSGVVDEIVCTRDGYYGFNTSSNKQMLALFHAIGINVPDLNAKTVVQWDYKHKKRAGQFDINFAAELEDDELATAIQHYGTLENDYLRAYGYYVATNKLYGTYVCGLPELVNSRTGRIHTSYNQVGARTGRYSSSKPNLQNLAGDGKLKNLGITGSIRHAFQPKPGRKLIIADYAAIELVIIADAAGDKKLIELVREDFVHEYVAQHVLGYTDITRKNKKEEPHKSWRQGAKRVSYSIAYGVTGASLAEQITLDLAAHGVKFTAADGEGFVRGWKNTFPQAGAWLDANARSVIENGYVTDGVGRKRYWDTSRFVNKWFRLAAQREASNFPVQSLSAHMTKTALINIYRLLDWKRGRIVLTVHDEIVCESTEAYAEETAHIMKIGMEKAAQSVLKHLGNLVIIEPAISDKYDK